MKRIVLFLICFPFFSDCFFSIRHLLSDDKIHQITIQGLIRKYVLHVSKSYRMQKPVSLVIVLHGGDGNGRNAEYMSGFTSRSDCDGFLVLYPYGTGKLFTEKLLT